MDTFRQKGQGDVADYRVARGPNKQIAPAQLEQTIGADVLQTLSQQTGMSREEILARLSKTLPDAVDKYTPEGRIPSAADFLKASRRFVSGVRARVLLTPRSGQVGMVAGEGPCPPRRHQYAAGTARAGGVVPWRREQEHREPGLAQDQK